MTPADAERFQHIQRDVGRGFAVTFKDLVWLVRLVERLDKTISEPPAMPPVRAVRSVPPRRRLSAP